MLDIAFIRDNKDIVKRAAARKGCDVDIDRLIELDDLRRAAQSENNDAALPDIMKEWRMLMLHVPNLPDMSVPEGNTDADNREIRRWSSHDPETGEPERSKPDAKSGMALLEELGMLDCAHGAKASGGDGMFLRGDGVRMVQGLALYAQRFFAARECALLVVPSFVRREALIGTGYIPQREDNLCKTTDGMFLTPSAIPAVLAAHMNDMLEREVLPSKTFTIADTYHRTLEEDNIHTYYETVYEQVILCEASHQESERWHEWLLEGMEAFFQSLGLSYRVVVNCGGRTELAAVKTYTIELWHQSDRAYRAIGSASYCHDFSTRRLNIRYGDDKKVTRFAHSLHARIGTVIPLLAAIVEQSQSVDGSFEVPPVLRNVIEKDVIQKNH